MGDVCAHLGVRMETARTAIRRQGVDADAHTLPFVHKIACSFGVDPGEVHTRNSKGLVNRLAVRLVVISIACVVACGRPPCTNAHLRSERDPNTHPPSHVCWSWRGFNLARTRACGEMGPCVFSSASIAARLSR